MKLRCTLGLLTEQNLGLSARVTDAKWSATRNSSVASCYQPSSCLVDDGFSSGIGVERRQVRNIRPCPIPSQRQLSIQRIFASRGLPRSGIPIRHESGALI